MSKQEKNTFEFSVIVPSRDRCDTLKSVLDALENQDFPKALFQVIVVDDASHDDTREFLAEFEQRTALHLVCVSGNRTTAGAARNMGLKIATGKRILFLDADTIPQSNTLFQHMTWHDHFGENSCILGYVGMSDELDAEKQVRINDTKTAYDGHYLSEIPWQDYRAANTCISRSICQRISGFDPELPAAGSHLL